MTKITYRDNKNRRKVVRDRSGNVRQFPNREAAKQFLRNRPYRYEPAKIE